ncbi:MAG: LamG-like jellyroll fold domain-containing protein [Candidatus Helarchaeota archaeon]
MSKRMLILLLVIALAVITFCTKKSTTPEEQLHPPTDLTISLVENDRIQINWIDNSTNETAYLIDRKKGNFDWLLNYGNVGASITSFNDVIPTNSDTVFSYRIRAFDEENYSEYSDTIAWFSENTKPTYFDIAQIAQDSLRLTWQDRSIGEDGFRIDLKIGNGNWIEDYVEVGENITEYVDYNQTLYDSCFYKIQAFKGISTSEASENYFIPFLPPPSDLELRPYGATEVEAVWEDNCHNEEGYRIYLRRGEEAVWDSVNIAVDSESYTDNFVIPGIINYYRVCAYFENETSNSLYSNINTMEAPTSLNCTQQNVHTFTLNWNDNAKFEQGFKIDRKIDSDDWVDEIGITPSNTTTWTDSTLGRNYNTVFYRLYAYYDEFKSESIGTGNSVNFPKPTDLTYEKINVHSIQLFWNDNSQSEEGFKIDKQIGITAWVDNYAVIAGNTEDWIDTDAEINENIQYRISAYYGNNNSDFDITNIIDNTFPAPSNINYEKLDIQTIQINWNDNSQGEEGFKIDKKVGENDWVVGYATLDSNLTTYRDNAEINQIIQYRVYGYYGDDMSGYTITDEIDNSIPAPSDLCYTKLNIYTIKLNWYYNSIGEQGFFIDKKVGSQGWQVEYGVVNENNLEWIDSEAEINESIQYRIYAYFENQFSQYVNTETINNDLPSPSDLQYDNITISSIKLTWQDNSSGEDGFKIDKKINNSAWIMEYGIVNENIQEWNDNNAEINDVLSYRIYTYYLDNKSQNIETGSIDNILPEPYNVDYEVISPGNIQIFWNYDAIGIQGFIVSRKVDEQTWVENYASVDYVTNQWVDNNLIPGSTHYYKVRAYYEDKYSEFSNEINYYYNLSNSSLYFDGLDDYVDIGTGQTLDVGGDSFTITAWINHTMTQGNAIAIVEVATFDEKYALTTGYLSSGQDKVGFSVGEVPGNWYYNAGSGLNDGDWHNIACVKNENQIKIYIDGIEEQYSSPGGYSKTGINKIGYGHMGYFKGLIDEVRIWNYALTENELNNYMAIILNGNEQGLVSNWRFDEGQGNMANDTSLNENNGVIYGAEWRDDSPF